MKKQLLLFGTLCAGLTTCRQTRSAQPDFQKVTDEYIGTYLADKPAKAVYQGFHEYDGKLNLPTRQYVARELAQLRHYDSTFAKINVDQLSPDERIDYKLLTATIKSAIHDIVDLKTYENPMTYSVEVSPYIERNFAPAEQRIRSVIRICGQLPAYYAAARQNVGLHPPREWVDVAVEGLRGSADYLLTDVPKAFAGAGSPALRDSLTVALKQGAGAMNGFAEHLTRNVLPQATGSFALGTANYRNMLLYNEQLSADPDSLLALGLAQLRREQAQFAEAARVIDPAKSPIEVYKAIQQEHPAADQLLAATRSHCEAIRQFLLDKQIVTVPSEVRATVTKTPDFMVGATAAMNTPGPFERPAASQAYYYVTLPKKGWTPAQRLEWLTQFNRYVSEIISIHEAYPGHYVQFLHLNASQASKTRKLFASYAFVEGWAHYTEQMMLEEGFGNRDRVTAAKYRMAQLSESLLRYCRLVSSIRLHTATANRPGWTVADATKFFMDNCYYEQKPAFEEARRGTFDPGYLSYSLGKLQLLALRDEMRRKQGKAFRLKAFHDAVLDQGMLPVGLLRERLIRD